jgi:hypothetical protein
MTSRHGDGRATKLQPATYLPCMYKPRFCVGWRTLPRVVYRLLCHSASLVSPLGDDRTVILHLGRLLLGGVSCVIATTSVADSAYLRKHFAIDILGASFCTPMRLEDAEVRCWREWRMM